MGDIDVDYDAVVRATERLRTGRGQLDETLQQLKATIDDLIGSPFKATGASGKLGDAYSRFTNAARRTLEALDGMGSYLDSVKQQHEMNEE